MSTRDDDEKMFPKALPESARELIQTAAQAEQIAADILENKRLLVELDRKRQSTMEALAAFRVKPNGQSKIPPGSKTWTNFGPFFMKLPGDYVKTMLETDQKNLNTEIETIRQSIKQSILQMQKFRPSELDPSMVEFAMKEAKRSEQGKEMEFDEEDLELIE